MDGDVRRDARVDLLSGLARLQTQLIAIVLLVATLLVPVVVITDQSTGSDAEPPERLAVFGLAARTVDFAEDIKELSESHPYGAPGGLQLTRIGIGLLLAGVVVTAAAVLLLIAEVSGRARWGTRIALLLLAAGVITVAIGLAWFPEYDDAVLGDADVGPAWGLLVPATAVIWVAIGRHHLAELERTYPI